ncbi:hypothetical protein [uncultured Brevundimonas sp.]|uniref:hypothetical protein n=1 Tax=uncultured Brevundimonas sp. TaxID=213418 RepID=UPI0030ED1ADE|tara:strand:+ start:100 stop:618 length:519 start_codon:yes stop_codon:yes gene_type:complete
MGKSTEFYGVLGRVTVLGRDVELRVYPFTFSTKPGDKVVLVVRFEAAGFEEAEVSEKIGEEVEGTVFPDRAEVHQVFAGTTTNLRAKAVTVEWAGYDGEDFRQRVDQLTGENDRLHRDLTRLTMKDRRGHTLTRELLRRAEIKAVASDALRTRQSAALGVLERLVQHFESDD